jgi:hypothetical protein
MGSFAGAYLNNEAAWDTVKTKDIKNLDFADGESIC